MSEKVPAHSKVKTAAAFLQKVAAPLSRYACYASAAVSLLMSFAIIVDLVASLGFDRPIVGMIEYETFLLVIMAFLSMAHTLVQKGHVSVDILTGKLPLPYKRLLDFVFSIWGLFVFFMLTWLLICRAFESYQAGEAATVTLIPLYPVLAVAAAGSALMTLALLADLIRALADVMMSFSRPVLWIGPALLCAAGIFALTPLLRHTGIEMGSIAVSVLFIGVLLFILIIGFPVAFAMCFIGFIGIWYLTDLDLAFEILKMNAYDSVAHYYYCVVPFFILMGFFCLESGVGTRLYNVGAKWFGRLPGGLSIGTIIGCGGFAAICGDSMATAATMGSVSLPEMKRYGYAPSLANGSVAAGGTLGILIPPSIGFIAYAIVTEQSIGKLFMAGVIPGILLTFGFSLMVYLRCLIHPELGPRAPRASMREKWIALRDIWPISILFAVVLGGIYSGTITPTEAGGVGVVGALLIAVFSKAFNAARFLRAIMISTQMTGMIFAILIGVSTLGYFVTLTDLPMQLAVFLKSLTVSRYVLFALILGLYLLLGMLMNIIPMIMLTLPILFPTITMLGFDPVWFGVIMVIMMEMGQITPPIGINVFVIHGIAGDVPMMEIYKGIVPFILVEILVIILLTIFPQIVMFLPDSMDVLASIHY